MSDTALKFVRRSDITGADRYPPRFGDTVRLWGEWPAQRRYIVMGIEGDDITLLPCRVVEERT